MEAKMETAEELGQKQTPQEMKRQCLWVLPPSFSHGNHTLHHLDFAQSDIHSTNHACIHSFTGRDRIAAF